MNKSNYNYFNYTYHYYQGTALVEHLKLSSTEHSLNTTGLD